MADDDDDEEEEDRIDVFTGCEFDDDDRVTHLHGDCYTTEGNAINMLNVYWGDEKYVPQMVKDLFAMQNAVPFMATYERTVQEINQMGFWLHCQGCNKKDEVPQIAVMRVVRQLLDDDTKRRFRKYKDNAIARIARKYQSQRYGFIECVKCIDATKFDGLATTIKGADAYADLGTYDGRHRDEDCQDHGETNLLNNVENMYRCTTCKHIFCSKCKVGYLTQLDEAALAITDTDEGSATTTTKPRPKSHNYVRCEEALRLTRSAVNEDALLAELTSVLCTKCKLHVHKIEGCNHMMCRCGHHFCYICGKDWVLHSGTDMGCQFDTPELSRKREEREKKVNEIIAARHKLDAVQFEEYMKGIGKQLVELGISMMLLQSKVNTALKKMVLFSNDVPKDMLHVAFDLSVEDMSFRSEFERKTLPGAIEHIYHGIDIYRERERVAKNKFGASATVSNNNKDGKDTETLTAYFHGAFTYDYSEAKPIMQHIIDFGKTVSERLPGTRLMVTADTLPSKILYHFYFSRGEHCVDQDFMIGADRVNDDARKHLDILRTASLQLVKAMQYLEEQTTGVIPPPPLPPHFPPPSAATNTSSSSPGIPPTLKRQQPEDSDNDNDDDDDDEDESDNSNPQLSQQHIDEDANHDFTAQLLRQFPRPSIDYAKK
jgi:hypothetical protein